MYQNWDNPGCYAGSRHKRSLHSSSGHARMAFSSMSIAALNCRQMVSLQNVSIHFSTGEWITRENAAACRFRRKVSCEMQVRLPAQTTHTKNPRPWRNRRACVHARALSFHYLLIASSLSVSRATYSFISLCKIAIDVCVETRLKHFPPFKL